MGVFIISPSDKGGMLYKPPKRVVELCEGVDPLVFNDVRACLLACLPDFPFYGGDNP